MSGSTVPAFCRGASRKASVNGAPATIENGVVGLGFVDIPCAPHETTCQVGAIFRSVSLDFGLSVEGSAAQLQIAVIDVGISIPLSITSPTLSDYSIVRYKYYPCSPSSQCSPAFELEKDIFENDIDPRTSIELYIQGPALAGVVRSLADDRLEGPFGVCILVTSHQGSSVRSLKLYDPATEGA
jgi:hypothetical protein